MTKPTARELYAQLYDVSVPDWPGEIDFYMEIIRGIPVKNVDILEIACGTGRVALQLTMEGVHITGIDIRMPCWLLHMRSLPPIRMLPG